MRISAYTFFFTLLLSALTVTFSSVWSTPAQAASTVAVVNVQKVMREAKAAQAIRDQVQSKQKAFQTELDQRESALQKEDQELAKQRSVLSQEAFEKKYREFREKAANVQKEVRAKRSSLNDGLTTALAQIQQKVGEIVAVLSKEKQFQVAISSQQVLYTDPALDITEEVISRLNAQLPSVTVTFK